MLNYQRVTNVRMRWDLHWTRTLTADKDVTKVQLSHFQTAASRLSSGSTGRIVPSPHFKHLKRYWPYLFKGYSVMTSFLFYPCFLFSARAQSSHVLQTNILKFKLRKNQYLFDNPVENICNRKIRFRQHNVFKIVNIIIIIILVTIIA